MAEWFTDWMAEHKARSAWGPDRDAMMWDWEVEFDGRGVNEHEADSASRWLMANDPPMMAKHHLAALLARIRQQRNEVGSRPAGAHEFGACAVCGESGMVMVPHPRAISDGEWLRPWYSLAAWCNCGLGRFKQDQFLATDKCKAMAYGESGEPRRYPPPSLEEYQQRYPHWRKMVEVHSREIERRETGKPGGKPEPKAELKSIRRWLGYVAEGTKLPDDRDAPGEVVF